MTIEQLIADSLTGRIIQLYIVDSGRGEYVTIHAPKEYERTESVVIIKAEYSWSCDGSWVWIYFYPIILNYETGREHTANVLTIDIGEEFTLI